MQRFAAQFRGFTLLECILYMALFSFLIEISMSSVLAFSESLARSKAKANLQYEKEFLTNKIQYEISNASYTLISTTSNPSVEMLINNSIDLYFSEDSLFSKNANEPPLQLSDSFATVTNGSFFLTNSSTLLTSFTLSEKTTQGQTVSEKVEVDSLQI